MCSYVCVHVVCAPSLNLPPPHDLTTNFVQRTCARDPNRYTSRRSEKRYLHIRWGKIGAEIICVYFYALHTPLRGSRSAQNGTIVLNGWIMSSMRYHIPEHLNGCSNYTMSC